MTANRYAEHGLVRDLKRLRAAYRDYLLIVTGSESPSPAAVVMAIPKWRDKKKELMVAGVKRCFDLIELAAIIESSNEADSSPGRLSSKDQVFQAATYLRAKAAGAPPAFIAFEGQEQIHKAAARADCKFFIALGSRLVKLEAMSPADMQMDNLKFNLRFYWAPLFIERWFWPGLAYMFNPARAKAYSVMCNNGRPYPERTLRGTWRRLGLKPAKVTIIREMLSKAGSIKFA